MRKRMSALVLLSIHCVATFYPGVASALTNGPTQPESSKFQSASVTNLVDPFTGDFSYNIPLLDVDGYPVNLAYNSGSAMDGEASWVGYGWNINPGSINRVMKGLPDDFNGSDKIRKEYNVKDDITGGVSFDVSFEVFGLDFLGATGTFDIFYNNHRGLGVQIGANVSGDLSSTLPVSGSNTLGLSAGGGLGFSSNSQTGADFNINANLGVSMTNTEKLSGALGLSLGHSLNSRAGLKSTTLGSSFNTSQSESKDVAELRQSGGFGSGAGFGTSLGSSTSSYGQAFTPTITMPMKNEDYSFSPMAGFEFWGFHVPTIQLTGNYTRQSLVKNSQEFPAYGFVHSAEGRTNPRALLDFNREKDVPYLESTPTIGVPYVTPDLFTATSHLGSSQFKAFSSSSGVFFDTYMTNTSSSFSLGVEFGGGVGVKGGADISGNGSSTVTRKWTWNNDFLANGDFSNSGRVDAENTYFKMVGEKSVADKDYLDKIGNDQTVKIKTANVNDQPKAFSTIQSNNHQYDISSTLGKKDREPRGEVFNVLTAGKAQFFGLDKGLKSYPVATTSNPRLTCNNGAFTVPGTSVSYLARLDEYRKAHHFSEITVTKNDGTRLNYGIPVYNNQQNDLTFNVKSKPSANPTDPYNTVNNFVHYDNNEPGIGNNAGIDNYYSKETIPAYATSFLLSAVCSPDYQDLTGDGISDDDPGTAVKFNYSRVNQHYKWRTPNGRVGQESYANFNAGMKSQSDDDKASISYGDKELWYLNTIESKNMIAVFKISNRADGYGYNPDGTRDDASTQKKLDQIDLFTKGELLSAQSDKRDPIPVKTVHFTYDYSLFPNVPNNSGEELWDAGHTINYNAQHGKLTLTSVYFTYGKSTSGEENRYYFAYSNKSSNPAADPFEYQQYDRWGCYKNKSWNSDVANLDNNDFPYTSQNQQHAQDAANKWQLTEIELPSGGRIHVEYESDDYAFVQNRRAMQMEKIVGFNQVYDPSNVANDNFTNYQGSNKIFIKLPFTTTNKNVSNQYFQGVDELYFKVKVDLDNNNNQELVSGYAHVEGVKLSGIPENDLTSTGDVAEVTVTKRGDYHPVAAASWQFLRQNLPKLAFPYNVDDGLGPLKFVSALIAAIRNVGELMSPFENRATRLHYGSHIAPDNNYARICNWMEGTGNECNLRKFGGGSRVKKISMDDIWGEIAGSGNGTSTHTGMSFDYTRKYKDSDGNDITISSGVASYEPMSGSEENPFKQPITYQQKAHLNTNVYTVEEPVGESYFPAASVGYSQVTIRNLDATGSPVTNGYSVKRFYTAQDFPTIVKRTDLSKDKYHQTSVFGLFSIDQGNSVVLSQGFYVENNDMHGKIRSDETFDNTGKMISGTYYHYKSTGVEQMKLDNNALTLQPDGTVKNNIIGQETEFFNDMREQVTDNTGVNLNINLDLLTFGFVDFPIPTMIPIPQSTYCGYQSAATIKVVNRYAIADKITKIENGSTITTENVLWDGLTGQVLLTKIQNGFDDPLYNFSLPAYLVTEYEKGMGAAYKNTGIVFNEVSVSNGVIPSTTTGAALLPFLNAGDQLGVTESETSHLYVWAIDVPGTGLRLIQKDGSLYTGTGSVVLLRSGRRNLMDASSYNVVSLKNPIKDGKIDIDVSTEIITTSATTYSGEWSTDVKMTAICGSESNIRNKKSQMTAQRTKNGSHQAMEAAQGDSSPVQVQYATGMVKSLAISRPDPGGICDCISPIDQITNPFFTGLFGNWRPSQKFVYTTERNPRVDPANAALQPTNIRKGGVFNLFTTFFRVQNGGFVPITTDNSGNPVAIDQIDKKWIASNTITKVNSKGQELENKNALDIYSSAQFGFNGHLATAVCNNSRSSQLGYDGFEDYPYNSSCQTQTDVCSQGHFDFRTPLRLSGTTGNVELVSSESHTGNYSMKVKAHQVAMSTFNYTTTLQDDDKFRFENEQMILNANGLNPQFQPMLVRDFVLSGWIKTADGQILTEGEDPDPISAGEFEKATILISAGIPFMATKDCGTYTAFAVKAGPKIEGWTRVMKIFRIPLPANCPDYQIRVSLIAASNADTYFDDIRIHPYDGNMKSFAYDYKTLRLMAELDENNYATFYEYDDEGQLVRNKKETDKGIITIKETRSRTRKNARN